MPVPLCWLRNHIKICEILFLAVTVKRHKQSQLFSIISNLQQSHFSTFATDVRIYNFMATFLITEVTVFAIMEIYLMHKVSLTIQKQKPHEKPKSNCSKSTTT